MKRALIVSSVVIAILSGAVPGEARDLPASPAGFSWVELTEVRAALLLPSGWHFRQRGNGDGHTFVYFLSPEPLAAVEHIEAGLTVSVGRKISEGSGVPAPAYAEALSAALSEGEELVDSWTNTSGTLPLFGARIRRAREGQEPVIFQRLAIGNGTTDTLYLIVFESPESAWQEMWKLGEKMLEQFLLDDTF